MNLPRCQQGALLTVALAVVLAGCRSEPIPSAPLAMNNDAGVVDLDAALTEAAKMQRPVIVLIAERGLGNADSDAIALLEDSAVKSKCDRVMPLLLDVRISRNRATGTRFHVTDTPMLVCLSPKGVIVSRDENPITKDLVLKRIDEAIQAAPKLDAQAGLGLTVLLVNQPDEKPAVKELNEAMAGLNLADFLLAHQNAREAIPLLAAVAHLESVETSVRVRAWVALARAHLWIAEPEKGRHEAQDLMATLESKTPEARAGGNLVLGLQDAKGKRYALARREFEDAIAAAPGSVYAKQAAEEAAKLPGGGK